MLEVTVYDVGQAASSMLQLGEHAYAVIDCGVDPVTGRNPVADAVKKAIATDTKAVVAFVMLTHLDFDHISGIAALLQDVDIRSRIKRLFCNAQEFRGLVEVAKAHAKPGSGVTIKKHIRASLESL